MIDPRLFLRVRKISHYARFYPTYYIKAEGEVDIAYISKGRFWPLTAAGDKMNLANALEGLETSIEVR